MDSAFGRSNIRGWIVEAESGTVWESKISRTRAAKSSVSLSTSRDVSVNSRLSISTVGGGGRR